MNRTNVATIVIFYDNELPPHIKEFLEDETIELGKKLADRAESSMVMGFNNKADTYFLEGLQGFIRKEDGHE